MYLERPLKDFIEDTASRTPTPGGGSVAALVGALGSCLLRMVGNFTIGKEKFKSVEKDMELILSELNLFTLRFCRLMQDDISAYQNFSRVSSLPEIVGDSGILIDPSSAYELETALERLLDNEELRRELSTRALKRSLDFSWEKAARKFVELYSAL